MPPWRTKKHRGSNRSNKRSPTKKTPEADINVPTVTPSTREDVEDLGLELWDINVEALPQFAWYPLGHCNRPIRLKHVVVTRGEDGPNHFLIGALSIPSIEQQRRSAIAALYHMEGMGNPCPEDYWEDEAPDEPYPLDLPFPPERGWNLDLIRSGKFPSINNMDYKFDEEDWTSLTWGEPSLVENAYVPVLFKMQIVCLMKLG